MNLALQSVSWLVVEGEKELANIHIARELPQFGRSVKNLMRERVDVFAEHACGGGEECPCESHPRPQLDTYDTGLRLLEVAALLGVCEDCGKCDLTATTASWPVIPHERICGPDVTDYVVGELMTLLTTRAFGDQVLGVSGAGRINLRSKVKGCPEKPVAKTKNCPRGCSESITLCGFCVSDQIPGNAALGMIAGAAAARRIGATDAAVSGGTDSPEDVASYDVGQAVAQSAAAYLTHRFVPTGYGGYTTPVLRNGARQAIRDALCAGIKKGVEGGLFANKFKTENCDPCPDGAWSR